MSKISLLRGFPFRIVLGGLITLFGGVDGLHAQDSRFDRSGQIGPGGFIEIKGVTGSITAERSSGSQVEIAAVKRGRRSHFDRVTFEVLETEDGVTVCAIFPSGRRRRPNVCNPGSWHNLNTGDVDVEVDFSVLVPAGVRFIGRTISGDVRATSLESDVRAYTVTGEIDISTSGLATASAVSGSITARMGRSDWRGSLNFNTVSGSIVLYFPRGLDCNVTFESVSGDFESDFPVSITSRRGFRAGHLRGQIGEGGRNLELRTVSGDIELRLSP